MRINKTCHCHLSLSIYLFVFILIILIHATELSRIWFLNGATVDLINLLVSSASQNNGLMVDQEEVSSVELKLKKLLDSNSKQEPAQYHAGQLAYWSGDYKTTIKTLWSSDMYSISPLAGWLLGAALWQEGYSDEAVKVLQLVENVEYYFMNQAMLAEAKRSYQVSERHYQVVRELMPGDPQAEAGYWFTRCMNLLDGPVADDKQAEVIIQRAISLNEDSAVRQLRLGIALHRAKQLALAEDVLLRAEYLDPHSYWPKYYLGLVYFGQGDYLLAQKKLTEVLETDPDFGRGHHWMARTLIKLGEHDPALAYYEKAVELIPEDNKLKDELQAFLNRQTPKEDN